MQITEDIFYQSSQENFDYNLIERTVVQLLLDDCIFVYFRSFDYDIETFRILDDGNKEETKKAFNEMSFQDAFRVLADKFGHPDDREKIRQTIIPEFYLPELANKKQVTVFFRWMTPGHNYVYNKVLINKLEPADQPARNVMIRCFEVEDEFRTKLEEDDMKRRYEAGVYALCREYTSVYYVELDKNQVCPYNLSNRITGMFGDKFYRLDYDTAIATYVDSAVIEGEKAQMLKILSRDEVIASIRKFDTYTHTYLNNENKYCEMKVVRVNTDDGSNVVIMGFAVNDEQIRAAEENKRKIDFQLSLLDGLGREYHTIWLIDPNQEMHLFRSTGVTTIKNAVQRGLDNPLFSDGILWYIDKYIVKEDRERVRKAVEWDNLMKSIPEVGVYSITYKRIDEKGNIAYHQMCFAKSIDPQGKVNIVFGYRDADEVIRQQLAEEQKYREAIKERDIDGLTGIYNRYSYERTIEEIANSDKETISCIYIDVDGLHELNNAHGHDAGDKMLCFVAENMAALWGRENSFRIGGDEFVSFEYDSTENETLDRVDELRSKIEGAGYSASIGCVTDDIRGIKIQDFIKWAESRMYDAKRRHYSGVNDRRKARGETPIY